MEDMGDLFIKVAINNEGKDASIYIHPEIDLQTLSVESIMSILSNNNVVFGIDDQVIKNIINSTDQFLDKEIIVARSKEPVNGIDGYIEWNYVDDQDKKPKELSDGRVDFYSINRINNIKKGQLIANKVFATIGEPGVSVTGKEIPARRGKEAILKPGKNVVLNDEKDKIYATIDGQVSLTDKDKINVFPLYEVSGDVDFSIGNIDFVGTVVIRGNVPDGFKINAAGDIKVYGNVEGAELIAKGDIFIQQGVVGHNKSFISAGRDFQAAFILDGNVYAKGNVNVSQSIMHSNVSAGSQVICKGVKGIIVGGKTLAGESIIASVIGNQMATATSIEVGINPELKKDLVAVQKKISEISESLDKVGKGLDVLERLQKGGGTLPADKKKLQINLLNQRIILEKELKTLKSNQKELEEDISNFDNNSIQVHKVIYPGVRIVIGKATKNIKSETKYIKYVLEDGEVVIKQL